MRAGVGPGGSPMARAAKEVEVHVINPRMKTFPFILTVSSDLALPSLFMV